MKFYIRKLKEGVEGGGGEESDLGKREILLAREKIWNKIKK